MRCISFKAVGLSSTINTRCTPTVCDWISSNFASWMIADFRSDSLFFVDALMDEGLMVATTSNTTLLLMRRSERFATSQYSSST